MYLGDYILYISSFYIFCVSIPVLSNGTSFMQGGGGGGGANKNVLRKTASLCSVGRSNRPYTTASPGQAVKGYNLFMGYEW